MLYLKTLWHQLRCLVDPRYHYESVMAEWRRDCAEQDRQEDEALRKWLAG